MLSMYAIPNCDTVKKARRLLEKNQVAYEFIDMKKCPPTQSHIEAWGDFLKMLPINLKGTTYRKYKDHFETLGLQEKIQFMIQNPSIIKRPVLMDEGEIIGVGFDEELYRGL